MAARACDVVWVESAQRALDDNKFQNAAGVVAELGESTLSEVFMFGCRLPWANMRCSRRARGVNIVVALAAER